MPVTYTKTVTLFQYDELTDSAKSRARDWFRGDDSGLDYEWWDSTYADFDRIAEILGIETRDKGFSGFWSQGDGARFAGSYRYAPGAGRGIRDYAPTDSTLHAIADRLQTIQRPVFYQATAEISTSDSRYMHEGTMRVEVDSADGREWSDSTLESLESELLDVFRDLARWLYRSLESEYEELTSDESIAETIRANEYTFDSNGKRTD